MEKDSEIAEAKNLIDDCLYEEAQSILEKYMVKYPENIECIDLLADLYFRLGDDKKALKFFKKSVKKEPNSNPDKYMTLAQLLFNPNERREAYNKAIFLYKKLIEEKSAIKMKNNEILTQISDYKDSISSALSSIVSLITTTDLCEEKDAEETCENCIKEALSLTPNSIEALLQFSNLRILRARDKEAAEALEKILVVLKEESEGGGDNLPERDMLVNVSQNFAEIGEYGKAIYVVNLILKQDDEDIESLYLLSIYEYHFKNYKSSKETLEKFKKLFKKDYDGSIINLEDVKDLEEKLAAIEKKSELKDENNEEGEEDEDDLNEVEMK